MVLYIGTFLLAYSLLVSAIVFDEVLWSQCCTSILNSGRNDELNVILLLKVCLLLFCCTYTIVLFQSVSRYSANYSNMLVAYRIAGNFYKCRCLLNGSRAPEEESAVAIICIQTIICMCKRILPLYTGQIVVNFNNNLGGSCYQLVNVA